MSRGIGFALSVVCSLCVAASTAYAKPGACCLPDGTCIDVDYNDCLHAGGIPAPEGLFCEYVDCNACRVTGGGLDRFGEWTGRQGHQAKCDMGNGYDVYTWGGEVGAPTALEPAAGEWEHHQKNGPDGRFNFHAGTSSAPEGTYVTNVQCGDSPYCDPARPAPTKQIDFEGVGYFQEIRDPSPPLAGVVAGVTLHYFFVEIEDLGEPGSTPGGNPGTQPPTDICPPEGTPLDGTANCECPDFYSIEIHATTDPGSGVIYHVYGYIDSGNLQIHPALD